GLLDRVFEFVLAHATALQHAADVPAEVSVVRGDAAKLHVGRTAVGHPCSTMVVPPKRPRVTRPRGSAMKRHADRAARPEPTDAVDDRVPEQEAGPVER